MDAIEDDDAETVTMILEDGLDPSSVYDETREESDDDEGDTLLHWAARFESPASAEVRGISAIQSPQFEFL